MSEIPVIPRPKFYRTKKFHIVVIGLAALIATPALVYYSMSYNSVSGTVVWLTNVRRVAGYPNVDYYLTIGVGSWSASIDIHFTDPKFSLVINSFPLGTVEGLSQTLKPYGQIEYSLAFRTDTNTEYYIGYSRAHFVSLTMNAVVNAGWYQEQVTKTDSATWTFSS